MKCLITIVVFIDLNFKSRVSEAATAAANKVKYSFFTFCSSVIIH